MKVKITQLYQDTDLARMVKPGEEIQVSDKHGKALIAGGVAESVAPMPTQAETEE